MTVMLKYAVWYLKSSLPFEAAYIFLFLFYFLMNFSYFFILFIHSGSDPFTNNIQLNRKRTCIYFKLCHDFSIAACTFCYIISMMQSFLTLAN